MKSVYLIMKKLMRSKFVLPGKLEAYAVFLLLVAGLSIRTAFPDLGYFSIHTDRDLYRTQQLIRGVEFPLVGSELSYGGRTFGPAMYLLCALPMMLCHSALTLPVMVGIMNALALAITWLGTRRFFGKKVALWALALYVVFPTDIAMLRFNWNPCLLPLFTAGAFFLTLSLCVHNRNAGGGGNDNYCTSSLHCVSTAPFRR